MNNCPNCGLPLLLVDSQGCRLYKCEVRRNDQADVERRSQDSPWKTMPIITRPIDRENADPMDVLRMQDLPWIGADFAQEYPEVKDAPFSLRSFCIGYAISFVITLAGCWYILN